MTEGRCRQLVLELERARQARRHLRVLLDAADTTVVSKRLALRNFKARLARRSSRLEPVK